MRLTSARPSVSLRSASVSFGLLLMATHGLGAVGCRLIDNNEEDGGTSNDAGSPPGDPCAPAEQWFTRCSGSLVLGCDGASWATWEDCAPAACEELGPDSARCPLPEGSCVTFGALRCSGSTLEQCNGEVWTVVRDCAPVECVPTSSTQAACRGTQVCSRSTGTYKVCDGTAVVNCNGPTVSTRIDCENITGREATNGTCRDLGGSRGPDCVLPAGSQCMFQDSLGHDLNFVCGRAGVPAQDMGCDYDDGCVAGMSGCALDGSDSYRCVGDHLLVRCIGFGSLNQPISMNCSSPGWGSGTCQNDICVVTTAGAPCYAGLVSCASPLICDRASESCR